MGNVKNFDTLNGAVYVVLVILVAKDGVRGSLTLIMKFLIKNKFPLVVLT